MEVKSNYDNSKMQDNDNYVSKMQNELKLIVFRVFLLILKDEDQSIILSGGSTLIMFFQFLTFIFQRSLYKVWKNENISYQLYNFFGYFMLSPYFEMLNFSSMVTMMYVIIGIIVISIMMIFFLGYTSRINYSWPVILLKSLIVLFTTILYLPILDLFFTIVNCKSNASNDMFNVVFSTEACWTGSHIIHGIVAIVSIAIFTVLTLTSNLLYFEAKNNHKDILSKLSGRAKAFQSFYWLILYICYTTIDLQNYDYVVIYIILIGTFLCFNELHTQQPHNHVLIQKLVSIFAALMLWSALMFCFSYYLEEKIFHGTIYAWIVGIPLIAFAVYKKDRYNYDLLLMNLNKQDDPQQIIQLTNYIHKLLSRYPTNQHFNIMLDALIEVHKTTCSKDDCVFKLKKQSSSKFQKMKDENISPRDHQIYLLLGEIYSSFIRKHQNLVQLRINYAFYLLEYTKQKQQALNEFCQIEQLSPALDNEFTIFRYKKIIEEEMNQNQNENIGGNLDVASELAFQNSMRQFQNKIERATLMHMDFWSQLQEDSPDLGKMNEIGAKINFSIIQVEELWNKMQKMTSNLPKAMRLYGKFIIEVLQDKDYGEELLEKAKVLQTQNNKMKNKQTIQVFSSEDLQTEPLPTLLVSTNSEKFVQITNMNLSVCNLFGYHKTELLNRKINVLIPSVYAKFHDAYIERFLQTNDQQKLQKERLVYLKLKSGYIAPCYLYMKTLQQLDENVSIAAQFRTIRTFKTACYLLLDSDEVIEQISSNCICNLLIDYKTISHRKIYFHELFPDYNRTDYLNKNGCTITFNLSTPLISNSNYLPYYVSDLDQSIVFQITVTEIENEHHDQVMGYVIKLEKAMNEQSQIHSLQLLAPAQNTNSFQFKYFAQKALYVGENQDEQNSARVDQTVIWEQTSRVSEETQEEKRVTKTEEIPKINYAEGIRTLKLFDNRIQDIEDIRMSFSEQDEVQHSSIFQRNQDGQEEADLGQKNVFRNRKALNGAINDFKQPEMILYLNWTVNFMMLIVVTLSFVAYFLGTFLFEDVQGSMKLFKYASIRNTESTQLTMNIQNLEMLKIGIWNLTEDEAVQYEEEQRKELNQSIYQLQDANQQIMLSNIYISDEIEELHSKSVVSVRVSKDTFQSYDLIQGTQQIISKALIIRDKPLSNMEIDDEDLNFVLYNLFNDILISYRNETSQYSYGIKKIAKHNVEIFFIVLIIAVCFLFVLLIIIVIFLIQINLLQEQILQLFIDIPEKTVKYLYNKSENFISNLQVGEEEELASDVSEEELDEQKELSRTLKSKRRRKIFKNTNSFHRTQIIITVFLICFFGGYYLLNYFLNSVTYNNFNQQLRELNVTVRCGSYYRFVDNAERQLFLNRNDTILLLDSYSQVQNNIQSNYDVDSELHQEHAQNQEIMNSDYYSKFQNVFMLNPCQIFTEQGYTTVDYCESFANGSIKQGMSVAMARHFENVRYLMTIYDMFYGHPEANFSVAARGWGKFRNITQNSDNVTNYIYNLNNFKQAKESRILQNIFVKAAYSYLVDQFITALKSDIEVTQTQLLAFFIVFEVLVFLIYFIVWLPASIRMTRDIWRTKGLILMIPLSVIQKIKSIKEFIQMLLKQ